MHGSGAASVFGITAICPKYAQPFLAKIEPIGEIMKLPQQKKGL